MYELVQIAENSYYIQSPAKIGLVKLDGTNVCLIDSGNDKDAGRKVRQLLDANKWRLTAVYNTHSNADHIGGNQYLQKHTGCRIFAPGIDCGFTRHPVLEPSFLYGGFPPKDLKHKFLMAQPSPAEDVSAPGFPAGVDILPLPGHFFDMTGYRTPDGTAYIADCLSSAATLEKYGVPFIYDVAAYLDTLRKLPELEARLYVPAHAEAVEDMLPYVAAAKICDCANIEVLRSFGVQNFDACFVCVNKNFQACLEITDQLKELGAKRVYSKADRDLEAKFLRRCGADFIIYPERDAAERIAVRESSDRIFDFIGLSEGCAICEIEVPEEWIGSFGKQYYLHQQSFPPVCDQSEEDWKIRMEGQLYETGQKLRVTGFDVLRDYICQELGQYGKEES